MTRISLLPADGAALARIAQWSASSHMARWLGFHASLADGELGYRMAFETHHVGNRLTNALHGGVISTFLQSCALAEVLALTGVETPRVISVHCNFLRPADGADMTGRARIMQRGRRIAFVEATGWQESEDTPVARAAIALKLLPEASGMS